MKLNFVKVNPVENMTIFIMDQIPREDHKEVSNKIMDYNNLHGEQVGFIERSVENEGSIRLQMMGGEFCGNATRSLAALMVRNHYPQVVKEGNKFLVDLEVSGIEESIRCEVDKIEENRYFSKIEMKAPLSLEEGVVYFETKRIEFTRVNLEGITHFIVDSKDIDDKHGFYESLKESIEDEDYDAFGIMYYDFENHFMEPLVYVKSTDSLFWERSCASGTCAFGAALAYNSASSISKDINQPGGILSVEVEYSDGEIKSIHLNGEVEIVAEGMLYL